MSALFTAQLVIYAILSLPIFGLILRHGRLGRLGWGFLLTFCTLRIIGGAMAVSGNSTSAYIISSIGISPLLLAVDGILHEARQLRNPKLNNRLEWTFMILMHFLIVAGVAVVAVGAAALTGDSPKPGDLTLVQVGMALLVASWAVLLLWGLLSLLPSQCQWSGNPGFSTGTTLLYGTLASHLFIGVRVLYTLIAECTQKPDLNPITGSLAVRVVLDFLPGLIATLIFIAVGWRTRPVGPCEDTGREIRLQAVGGRWVRERTRY